MARITRSEVNMEREKFFTELGTLLNKYYKQDTPEQRSNFLKESWALFEKNQVIGFDSPKFIFALVKTKNKHDSAEQQAEAIKKICSTS